MQCSRRGFTLIEVLIVVTILGTLAVLVLPHVTNADEDSRRAVFVRNLKHFQQGVSLHATETGEQIADADTGVCPEALWPFVDVASFESGTSLGGQWDVEAESSGVTLAIGVHFTAGTIARDDAYMADVDRLCDDGNLATGNFRKLAADRFYWVLIN